MSWFFRIYFQPAEATRTRPCHGSGPAWIAVCLLILSATLAPGATLPDPVPLKVACVGDSITQGSGLSDPVNLSYPGKLSKLMGTQYQVRNFGVSGTTLLKKGDMPYWKQSAFASSTNFHPDIVIIKLGSNDSKPQNWRYGTNYVQDYLDLIAVYTNLPSHPRLFLCTPCPVYKTGAFSINPGIVSTNIAPAVRGLCELTGHSLIDVHEAMSGHPEWFPDTVHPNAAGTSVLAALVCRHLMGLTDSPAELPQIQGIAAPSNRLNLAWPLSGITFVLESAPAFKSTNTVWSVVDRPIVNRGDALVATNLAPGALRFYQLRRY
ncbi:MAG TPA: GDSL-type esterase/lipase family protein [Candidatus Paceibacterota bacterium]|nr:GDSL-type esterase/lipase family protein [Verrucomicrobiota bacterium]HRY48383.1 GDSL-type esterase/lipase family protein [Candidatus Paceibacterota bacterium]HSA00683.1 GDSL-type esterase/lipase family protein [Candidatus Paceibacterota bacterium]